MYLDFFFLKVKSALKELQKKKKKKVYIRPGKLFQATLSVNKAG